MAIIDRSDATRAPFVERLASVGTNWQAWTAPHWCTQAVVRPSAAVHSSGLVPWLRSRTKA